MTARLLPFERSRLAEAAAVVKGGGLIVYPTDTVYGLGCDPLNSSAVERLFRAKGRETKPVPLLCDSLDSVSRAASLNERSLRIARRFWPGALTIVAPAKAGFPFPIHQGTGTVGVRVPGSPLCIELVRMCGGLLTGTSANLSGRPSCRSADEAGRELGGVVDLILDGGRLEGMESTVVRVHDGGIEVLRRGAIPTESL